jgi:hypothetical protein
MLFTVYKEVRNYKKSVVYLGVLRLYKLLYLVSSSNRIRLPIWLYLDLNHS